MEKGIIEAKSQPIWTKRQKLTIIKRKDEIALGDFMSTEYSAAYYCPNCRKIIINIDEKVSCLDIK
ncbi:MAG: hypothetical protein IJW74_03515 [Oscillospiraceae bacterium]|nr:hypothetical protein [Oscillospiraceae bacterium]